MNLNLRVVNLLNLVVLGNVKCEINVVFDLHHVVELDSVHVTLANICVTRSGTMHLTLSCEVHRFRIVPFGQPENGGRCVDIWFLTRVPFIYDFDSVTLLFYITPISGV
jgi:hypothetical protein